MPSTKLKGRSVAKIYGVTASQADVEVTFDLPKLEKAEIFDPSWVNLELLCSEKEASKRGSVGPFGLLVLASNGLEEQTAVYFRIFKDQNSNNYVVLMCSDHSRSSLVKQDLDKTTYGPFLNEGKACVTSRVYPKLAIEDRAQLHVFNNGTESMRITSLSAWSVKKATRILKGILVWSPLENGEIVRDTLNAKRYEMDLVLPVINRMENARSIDDMLMEYLYLDALWLIYEVKERKKSGVIHISIEKKRLSSEYNLVGKASSGDRKLLENQQERSISVKHLGKAEDCGSSSTS
ncbi:hypothetical protein GIB67_039748 [Kingdonia uniflora]|uniref:Glycosyl hydrolase family 32 C-terminal domain-containing protein n=1 Tax=Kingdonia uniflora TaxID=39325 RepID=A0A7J7MQ82_9MAGN|nr:hypothetical protein GIB67_039748 [Kingdonia uniflora]